MDALRRAACGLNCSECNLYRAGTDLSAAEALVDWFRQRGWIEPGEGAEAIQRKAPFCRGCWEQGALHWCGDCFLRACCIRQNLNDCGECVHFPCQRYRAWAEPVDHHNAAMECLLTRSKAKE